MRALVNFIIMLALPFVLTEDKSTPETPPSQRIQEIRADTTQLQQKKVDFAKNAQQGINLGNSFPVVAAKGLE